MPTTQKDQGDDIRITISHSVLDSKGDLNLIGKQTTTTTGDLGANATFVSGVDNRVAPSQVGLTPAEITELLITWRQDMDARIEAQTHLSEDDKGDYKETVAKIEAEAAKAEQAKPDRLERLINTLAAMGSDIFEVAVTTLANPLSGIGLVLKKISDKAATVERANQPAASGN